MRIEIAKSPKFNQKRGAKVVLTMLCFLGVPPSPAMQLK